METYDDASNSIVMPKKLPIQAKDFLEFFLKKSLLRIFRQRLSKIAECKKLNPSLFLSLKSFVRLCVFLMRGGAGKTHFSIIFAGEGNTYFSLVFSVFSYDISFTKMVCCVLSRKRKCFF